MTKLRPLHSLTEKDQGVAIVREEIRKDLLDTKDYPFEWIGIEHIEGVRNGLERAIQRCDDRLDIATLGEIDMKGGDV